MTRVEQHERHTAAQIVELRPAKLHLATGRSSYIFGQQSLLSPSTKCRGPAPKKVLIIENLVVLENLATEWWVDPLIYLSNLSICAPRYDSESNVLCDVSRCLFGAAPTRRYRQHQPATQSTTKIELSFLFNSPLSNICSLGAHYGKIELSRAQNRK